MPLYKTQDPNAVRSRNTRPLILRAFFDLFKRWTDLTACYINKQNTQVLNLLILDKKPHPHHYHNHL